MNNSGTIHLITQNAQKRAVLENAVLQALELARTRSDAAEVVVTKTTGMSIRTRYSKVENIEFNSDGALVITVYCQQRKGKASSTDFSPDGIARTVTGALDIAHYTSPDPSSGPAEKTLLAFQSLDLDLFHPSKLDTKHAIALAASAEQVAIDSDTRINNNIRKC